MKGKLGIYDRSHLTSKGVKEMRGIDLVGLITEDVSIVDIAKHFGVSYHTTLQEITAQMKPRLDKPRRKIIVDAPAGLTEYMMGGLGHWDAVKDSDFYNVNKLNK